MSELRDRENRRLVKWYLKVDAFEDEKTPKYRVTLYVTTAKVTDRGCCWSGNNLYDLIATAKHWAPELVAEYRSKYGSPGLYQKPTQPKLRVSINVD